MVVEYDCDHCVREAHVVEAQPPCQATASIRVRDIPRFSHTCMDQPIVLARSTVGINSLAPRLKRARTPVRPPYALERARVTGPLRVLLSKRELKRPLKRMLIIGLVCRTAGCMDLFFILLSTPVRHCWSAQNVDTTIR